MDAPLLEVSHLSKSFPPRRALRRGEHTAAVVDASFTLAHGETLALVGESGSGKSTLGRCLLRLLEPDTGRILYRRTSDGAPVDVRALRGRALRAQRRELGIVFQDPGQSLNPRLSAGEAVAEPLRVHGLAAEREARARAAELCARVGLEADALPRFPHEFSGGQRQRIAIARALALGPRALVLDEAVSALDVSIRAQILDLLLALQRERALAYLFITHDLALAARFAQRVAVMSAGAIVECGRAEEVLARPQHPATRRLVASMLSGDPRRRRVPGA